MHYFLHIFDFTANKFFDFWQEFNFGDNNFFLVNLQNSTKKVAKKHTPLEKKCLEKIMHPISIRNLES